MDEGTAGERRSRRQDRLTEEERKAQEERWRLIMEQMAADGDEEEGEGLEEDSEFDNHGEEEFGEEEEFISEENDLSAARHSIASQEEAAARLLRASENAEDERRKKEHELIEKNLSKYPFFRGVHAEVDFTECERIQYSYIKLPETYVFAKSSGQEEDPICTSELNAKYVGAPPPMRSSKAAIIANPAKSLLLMGEDKMYEADMSYYQVTMALKFLEDYSATQGDNKERIAKKFRKHAGNIDTFFKEASLETDVENIRTQLQAILGIRERSRKNEEDDYVKKSAKLFIKSLDQRYYNAVCLDKDMYQEQIKDLLMYRQLQYETILKKEGEELKRESYHFTTPYFFVRLVPKALGSSQSAGASRTLIAETLNDSTSGQAFAPKTVKYQNGKKVEVISDELQEEKSVKMDSPSKFASQKLPASINKDNLWPLFIFDVKNRIVLDSAVSILFDTLDATYDEDTKYALQMNLYKIFGRLFGMAKTDFMSPIVSNDLDQANLKKMFDSLAEYKDQIQEELDQLELSTAIDQSEIEPNDLKPFVQSRKAIDSMSADTPFLPHLEFFQESDKDLIHFYGVESLSKVLLLFFNLYQRMNLVWSLFEKLARKHDSFDLLKMFNHFKDSVIQSLIMQHTCEGIEDPEVFYKEIFGGVSPVLVNIPNLVSRILKRVLLLCSDYSIRELLNLQAEAGFTPLTILKFLENKYITITGFLFQLCSFDKKSKKLYIHNLRLESTPFSCGDGDDEVAGLATNN